MSASAGYTYRPITLPGRARAAVRPGYTLFSSRANGNTIPELASGDEADELGAAVPALCGFLRQV